MVKMNLNYLNKICVNHQIRMTCRSMTKYYDKFLKPYDLKSTQFSLLVAINSQENGNISQISNSIFMERTTFLRNLKPLLKKGLVKLDNIETRRKDKIYKVTPEGKLLLDKSLDGWEAANDEVEKSLDGKANRKIFLNSLNILREKTIP